MRRFLFCWVLARLVESASWADGRWYDAPSNFNVPVTICKKVADGVPCSKGWSDFRGACYLLIGRSSEYRQAVQRCREHAGSKLVSITSAEENHFVQQLCGLRLCWLGLREKKNSEQWEWLDGSPAEVYMNWKEGEPNNFKGKDENVAMMNFDIRTAVKDVAGGAWASGTWYDVPASFNRPKTICEMEESEETPCAKEWQLLGGSCYRLMDWHSNFADARARCSDLGAHLVTISSIGEQEFVRRLCGPRICWLGLEEHRESESWFWIDGGRMSYQNWEKGEPNNGGGIDENRAVMNMNMNWVEDDAAAWVHKAEEFKEEPPKPVGGAQQVTGLVPWADGKWYDAPPDFNLPVTICKLSFFQEPTSRGFKDAGWVSWQQNHYLLIDRYSDYPTAVRRCDEHMGSRLVTISSEDENRFVQKLCGNRFCWLGLQERPNSEEWAWIDGMPLVYGAFVNWQDGEPNNFGGRDESVAMMHFNMREAGEELSQFGWASGKWSDVPGAWNVPTTICERPLSTECDEAWETFQSSCYRRLDWHSNYADAKRRCSAFGGHLVTIHSMDEQNFVMRLCGKRTCWLGLEENDLSQDMHHVFEAWHWADGTEMTFENWARGEPNNFGGHSENRAVMNMRIPPSRGPWSFTDGPEVHVVEAAILKNAWRPLAGVVLLLGIGVGVLGRYLQPPRAHGTGQARGPHFFRDSAEDNDDGAE